MAEAMVLPLVSKLQEVALSEGRALVGVGGEINRLRDKLMWLMAFLQEVDPQRRARANELMRVLVHQTRDAAFSAEDAVDDYVVRIDLSRYPGWSRAAIGFLAGITTQLRVRRRLSNDIGAIHARLEEIVGNKDTYRLEDSATAPPSLPTWTASAPSSSVSLHWGATMPEIIGRDDKQEKLEDRLLSSIGRLTVIYVVGESGVGKTILVNSVYAKESVRKHFKVSIVVKVEKNAGISNILSLICKQLKNTKTDHEEPSIVLQNHLGEQRYLIVIDGRHMAIADWNAVIHALPKNEEGSRVVLITKKVPKFLDHPMHDVCEIKLTCLDYMNCKKLFHIRLHGKEEEGQTYPKRYYRSVHNITGGLPLAVILLAGLMHDKEYPHEWDNVFKYLESAKSKRLDRILSLSFDDLHHELKLCLLYFIAFPESYKVYQGTLVKLWVSEGFVAPQHGKTAEQLGQLYLRQLTTRGLVTETTASDGGFRHFVLHDSVYLFARSEAQVANFMELHDGDYFPSPDSVRRLTLQNSMDKYAALDNKMPKLRSIFAIFEEEIGTSTAQEVSPNCFVAFCSGRQNTSPKISRFDLTKLLKRSKFLRVIMIKGLDIGTELPEAIGSMVHLRYLGLRCGSLMRIHPSIGNLNNLQTIDVTGSPIRKLPLSFWKITSLRHVFGKLNVPRHTSELKELNTLNSVTAGQDWDGSILTRMANLKFLDVTIKVNLKEEKALKFSGNLNKLNNLTILILQGVNLPMSRAFTSPSLQRLKTMKLTGTQLQTTSSSEMDKMSAFPDFQLPNLSELSLSKTYLQQGFIEKLGKLPLLSNLTLKGVSCDGEEVVFKADRFHCLRKVEVNDTPKSVLIEENALPALDSLHIIGNTRNYQHRIHPTHKFVKMIKEQDINLFQHICTEN